jgi:hypothetical protein
MRRTLPLLSPTHRPARRPARHQDRRGFALVMVILTVVVLTMLVLAAFTLGRAEHRINEDNKAQIGALAMAQKGLDQYVFHRQRESVFARDTLNGKTAVPANAILPPGRLGPESLRVVINDPVTGAQAGYADVILTRLRAQNVKARKPNIYLVRSHAVETANRLPNTPPAEHTVAKYIEWRPQSMNVVAGWSALSGLQVNGISATLSGVDDCAQVDAVAGAAVPLNPGFIGSSGTLNGIPKLDTIGVTPKDMYKELGIDWPGIISGKTLQPTHTIPPETFSESWFKDPGTNNEIWPTILVKGNFVYPMTASKLQGTLIVTGNLVISGDRMWEGIILVGGTATSDGNNTVEGAVVTGLNVALDSVVPITSIGNGTKTFQYNSCNVEKAANSMGNLAPYQNAWSNNWTY